MMPVIFRIPIIERDIPSYGLMMMIGFLVLRQMRILKITVEVGFVTGVTAKIGPRGCAMSVTPSLSSQDITPAVFSFRMSS